MNLLVPWAERIGLITLHAPSGKTGRPPFAVATMLRIHFMQQWLGLSDPAMEEALHDVPSYREFSGLDAGITRLPDESTILRFRHLLEANDVTQGHGLLHGEEEEVVFADAGYQGAMKRPEATGVDWKVAMRPGKRRALDKQSPWVS